VKKRKMKGKYKLLAKMDAKRGTILTKAKLQG
jgi:hypothetical protein